MRILEKSEVYNIEKDNENKAGIFNLVNECHKEGILSDKRFNEVMTSLNETFRLRHDFGNIDNNFREIFSVQGPNKIASFANYMGAEMGGLEVDGSIVLCTNVEMGINFRVANPKKEKIEDYLTLVDLIAQGLQKPENFKTIFNANTPTIEAKEVASVTFKM